jgi:hypothetical protein
MITNINEFKNSLLKEKKIELQQDSADKLKISLDEEIILKHAKKMFKNIKTIKDVMSLGTSDYNKLIKHLYNLNEGVAGIKALPVSVYKSPLGDSSNNGLTSKKDDLLLVFENANSPFKTKENEDYLVLIKKVIGGKEYLSAKPQSLIESNT